MLHGRKEDHKGVITVYQELHLQLAKGVRKLYITMQDISDVIFAGMLQTIGDLPGNISVS